MRRWVPGPTEALSRVRLRAGRELLVINISASGALVEGPTRLLPGTNVDVHVTAAQGRVLVRARVIRCGVWTVSADVVQYRGALAFNTLLDLHAVESASTEVLTAGVTDPRTVEDSRSLNESPWSGVL
jgi:hypothetical protein